MIMKCSKILLICYLLSFNPQQTVSSITCSANEKIGDFCFDDALTDSKGLKDYLKYLEDGSYVFLFHEAEKSEWLIQNIDKYPQAAGTIGLGISILLLYDSWADDSTNKLLQQYNDLLKTPATDFATEQIYYKFIFKETNRLRDRVIELKSRKVERIIFKTIFASIFGWIGWATTTVVLKPLACIASLFGFIAGGIDAYQWLQLSYLAEKFQKTGYIV